MGKRPYQNGRRQFGGLLMGKASRRKRERRKRGLAAAIEAPPQVVKGLPFPGRLFSLARLRAAIRRGF